MRRRGIPIGYIGVMIVSLAFVAWYGWTTQVAPYMQESHHQQAQDNPPSGSAPSEAEVRAVLEKNKQSLQAQPTTTEQPTEPKPPIKVEVPKPDPTRDVMDYWWEMKPIQSGKK